MPFEWDNKVVVSKEQLYEKEEYYDLFSKYENIINKKKIVSKDELFSKEEYNNLSETYKNIITSSGK